jgi:hypothetical protein
MNIGLLIIGSLLPLIILERVLLHVLIRRKRRRLSFTLYYFLGLYKPLVIVAGFAALVISRAEGLLPLIVVLSLGILSALVSYPVARFFHSRMGHRDTRENELGE